MGWELHLRSPTGQEVWTGCTCGLVQDAIKYFVSLGYTVISWKLMGKDKEE